jgi:hypothetical protein
MGIAWLKAVIWKLRRIKRRSERGRCPLCLREEDAKHILLKCSEMENWREEFLYGKWLSINGDIAYNKIINRTNVTS